METVTIAELRAGGEVDGVFACTRKDRLTARNGSPYLAVELRDRTGAIPGRAFRDADFLAGQFERGDLVSVAGRVERFRDELQVDLRAIKTAEADPSEFLPVAYRDLEELDGFLEHLAREVYDPDYARSARRLPRRRGIPRRAAPRAVHPRRPPRLSRRSARAHRGGGHAGAGVVRSCIRGSTPICSSARRSSTTSGKTLEFDLGAEIQLSEAGALMGHVALGQQLVAERARTLDSFPDAKLHAISHCILAHHGIGVPPGTSFPLCGGACALPAECAGCRGQGRLGARALAQFRCLRAPGQTHVLNGRTRGCAEPIPSRLHTGCPRRRRSWRRWPRPKP